MLRDKVAAPITKKYKIMKTNILYLVYYDLEFVWLLFLGYFVFTP